MKAELLNVMGDDLMVVNAARVSMGKWKDEFSESDASLISYLAKHNHFTPFCHPKVQLRVTMPIFVARQYEKHRIGAVRGYEIYDHNEISRRYVDEEPAFYEPLQWRARPDKSIKQGSGEPLGAALQIHIHSEVARAYEVARTAYESLLRLNVAPEQARMILPQSMYTSFIETGSLYFYANLCKQRLDSHAQAEIQDLARQVAEIIEPLFPASWAALMCAEISR
jgi:thymidylate synthase (FAD)